MASPLAVVNVGYSLVSRRAGVCLQSPSCRPLLLVVGNNGRPADTDVVFYLLILIQGSLQDAVSASCFFVCNLCFALPWQLLVSAAVAGGRAIMIGRINGQSHLWS